MLALHSFIRSFSYVGFSGSRSCPVACGLALGVIGLVPLSVPIVTGCASGVDSVIRSACLARPIQPHVIVAHSSSRSALALRSQACVRYVSGLGGLWCAFPSATCPVGLVPSPHPYVCFAGYRSGTWSSLALAVGLGCAVAVVLPPHVSIPSWFAGRFSYSAGAWYCPARPVLSLF